MSNSSLENGTSNLTSAQITMSLDELLNKLGFDLFKTVITSFILPFINVLGTIFCSLSFWIFSHKKFKDPVFFYYRLLCIVYIIHLIHNIPRGLLYSPRYFPNMNTYLSSLFQLYHSILSAF